MLQTLLIHLIVGQRVAPADELEGLDIPEMALFAIRSLCLNQRRAGLVPSINEPLFIEGTNMTNAETLGRSEFVELPAALRSARLKSCLCRRGNPLGGNLCFSRETPQQQLRRSPQRRAGADFTDAHVFLGVALSLTSDIYPALDHLEAATKLDADSFGAHFTLAKLNFKLRIVQKGNEAATDALRCVPDTEQRKMLTQLMMEERTDPQRNFASVV
jgi:hypothetical protein